MKKLFVILVATTLTGCAFGPGNPVFDSIALAHDRADPCQEGMTPERKQQLGRPEGYKRPDWCFASMGRRTTIYDRYGRPVGYIK